MTALFHITCVTCRAKLEVRNARAIGQILSCPSCGSLVEVRPPEGWRDPEADQETIEDVSVPEEIRADSPPVPGDDWISPGAKRLRRVGLAVGGLIVAVVLALVVWQAWPEANDPRAERPPAKKRGDGAADAKDKKPDDADKETQENKSVPKKNVEPPDQNVPRPGDAAAEPQEKKGVDAHPMPPDGDPMRPAGEKPEDVDKGDGATPGAEPPGADKAEERQAEATPPGLEPDRGSEIDAAAGALERLEAMINPSDATGDEAAKGADGAPGAGPEAPRPASRPSRMKARDIQGALVTPLVDLRFDNVPLHRLPRIVFELTAVPLTLEHDALRAKSVSLDTTMKGQWHEAALKKVLDDVAGKHGLSLFADRGSLRLGLADDAKIEAVFRRHAMLAQDVSEGTFRAMLLELLDVAPADARSLEVKRTDDEWIITAPAALMRRLRGLQAQYVRRQWERWANRPKPKPQGDSPASDLAKGVDEVWRKRVRLSLFTPASMLDVFDDLQEMAGVRFVLDWSSLAPCGCGPDTEVALVMADRPLAEVLYELVAKSEATFRQIDERTIEIRGAMVVERGRFIKFHSAKLGEGEGKTAVAERLAKEFGDRIPTWYWLPEIESVVLRADRRVHARFARCLNPRVAP